MELVSSRVLDQKFEKKAVELRFRKRVGSFHLQRILSRQDQERIDQRVGLSGNGDGPLLHCFQQRRLCLRRGPVDFVGQHDVGEERSLLQREFAAATAVDHDVGSGNVRRHQVGRELDSSERNVGNLAECTHQEGLAQTRNPFEEHMLSHQKGNQHILDHILMTDDDAFHFIPQLLEFFP